jgi:hypothetical protein
MWKQCLGKLPIKVYVENLHSSTGKPWRKFETWYNFEYFALRNLHLFFYDIYTLLSSDRQQCLYQKHVLETY